MLIFFTVFFALYAAVNYYIFIRGWQALALLPSFRWVYLTVFLISSLSYFAAKMFGESLPETLYDLLLWIGSFWFAYILYLFLSVVLIDLLRLINWQFDIFPSSVHRNYDTVKLYAFLFVLVISSTVILFGYLNTRNIKINTHEIVLAKGNSTLAGLNIVFAADFHLTPINNGVLLKEIVDKINSLNPDIVLLPGDIVDDKAAILHHRNIGNDMLNIKSRYGVYASNGNHEFITGVNASVEFMTSLGLTVLRDTAVMIDNSFYIAGRDDRAKKNFTGLERKDLKSIVADIPDGYPVILLDHTPLELEEAERNNIALQLSGHTHHGQLFPANLITSMIYEVSWGYLKKGNTQYYVTSGVGTWGPPVRIGSDAEIVNLKIRFAD